MYAKPWLFSKYTGRNRIHTEHIEKPPGAQKAIYTYCYILVGVRKKMQVKCGDKRINK